MVILSRNDVGKHRVLARNIGFPDFEPRRYRLHPLGGLEPPRTVVGSCDESTELFKFVQTVHNEYVLAEHIDDASKNRNSGKGILRGARVRPRPALDQVTHIGQEQLVDRLEIGLDYRIQ